MRLTTGLLLAVAVFIPGAVRAQFGGPGSPYDPYGHRPGAGGIPGLPNGYGRFGRPGMPGMLGGPGATAIPGLPSGFMPYREAPYVRVEWPPNNDGAFRYGRSNSGFPSGLKAAFPLGVVAPYDPTARFRNAGGILPPSPAIPDFRNLPQVAPPQFDYKLNVKPDLNVPPTSTSWQPWGCGSWSGFITMLLWAGAAAWGRRPSKDRK